MLRTLAFVSVVAAAVAIGALVPAGESRAVEAEGEIVGFAFSPSTFNVEVGDTITLTNKDAASHTFTSDNPGWDTGTIMGGGSGSATFNEPGSFPFHCTIHPFMTGTVNVTGAQSTDTETPIPTPTEVSTTQPTGTPTPASSQSTPVDTATAAAGATDTPTRPPSPSREGGTSTDTPRTSVAATNTPPTADGTATPMAVPTETIGGRTDDGSSNGPMIAAVIVIVLVLAGGGVWVLRR